MARKPRKLERDLTGSPAEVLNAVRNGASTDYQEAVPYATNEAEVIRKIGAILLDNPIFYNEFLNGLVNRIGKVIFASDQYWENPLGWVNKGVLDYGETVEDIFVDIAKPHQFDPAVAEDEWMKREVPDVKTVFHTLNYTKFYKSTIQDVDIRKAFTNASGVERMIAEVIGSMYKAARYDLYQATRYLIGINMYDGYVTGVKVAAPTTTENLENIVAVARAIRSELEFPSRKYNTMKVLNETPVDRLRFFISTTLNATMDVKVLANAFNMDKAEFLGKKVVLPPWKDLDVERLDMLFKGEQGYHSFTEAELEALDNVVAFIVDEEWFQFYDTYIESHTSPVNGEGLYYNNWYHIQKILSASPFRNAIMLIGTDQTVVSITLNVTEVKLPVGANFTALATVATTGFAPKTLKWTSSNENVATVDATGCITAIANGTATITAKSDFDGTKTATISVTVGDGQ